MAHNMRQQGSLFASAQCGLWIKWAKSWKIWWLWSESNVEAVAVVGAKSLSSCPLSLYLSLPPSKKILTFHKLSLYLSLPSSKKFSPSTGWNFSGVNFFGEWKKSVYLYLPSSKKTKFSPSTGWNFSGANFFFENGESLYTELASTWNKQTSR